MLDSNLWNIKLTADDISNDERIRTVSHELGINRIIAALLVSRGYETPEAASKFISKETEMLHDAFEMRDMAIAARTVLRSVKNNEKIAIYGDYDVDGVTAVSCLYLYLSQLGADVVYYIPCRSGEGYGMSELGISKLCDMGVKLIVTVDTGITATKEAELVYQKGMRLVITDHHECCGDIPSAEAVVNPHRPDCPYPFKELAGVGVVFKLITAMIELESGLEKREAVKAAAELAADLVAIGTIADVMPITDENRLIVAYGLSRIAAAPRPGIEQLLIASDPSGKKPKKITSGVIGFTVAPRINAAGRMDDAGLAVKLFLAKDQQAAAPIAARLCDINKQRQDEENKILAEAISMLTEEELSEKNPVIVLASENWHHGIIGIVASRLTEKYGRPSILISFEDNARAHEEDRALCPDDIGKGSGRSIKGMNLVNALQGCSELLVKFGGHELAAGLSVRRDQLQEFKKKINEYARGCFDSSALCASFDADCELREKDLELSLAESLYLLEPYGTSNPQPLFASFDMQIVNIYGVGSDKHTRITFKCRDGKITCMYFRKSPADIDLYTGDHADVLYNLDINEFNGTRSLQMIVRDMRPAGKNAFTHKTVSELRALRAYLRGESDVRPKLDSSIVPTRDDIAAFYKVMRHEARVEHEVFSLHALEVLMKEKEYAMPAIKLGIITDILNELGLFDVRYKRGSDEIYTFFLCNTDKKTSLDNSQLLCRIREEYSAI